MPTTPKGLYYPDGSESVKLGASAIENLATGVDDLLDDYQKTAQGGFVGTYASLSANTPSIGTSETEILRSPDITVDENVPIKVTFSWPAFGVSAAQRALVQLRLGSASGTVIGGRWTYVNAGNSDGSTIVTALTLTAGTTRIVVTAAATTGTIAINATSTSRAWLLVERFLFS